MGCIQDYTGDDRETFPNRFYIDPEEHIKFGVCEPACPWEAIFQEDGGGGDLPS